MPPRHPTIAAALGQVRAALYAAGAQGPAPRPPVTMLVACSGGADSVALLGLLHLLAEPEQLRVGLAHCDHGLREASAAEAEHVRSLAQQLGLPVFVDRLELAPGAALASRARHARRAALRERARQFGAHFIALGHTATDQAETVLLNLCRGAGVAGLSGMPVFRPESWNDEDEGPTGGTGWLRPLLSLTRSQTRALAIRLQLPFVDDPTNEDVSHPRVRIRNRVLPELAHVRDGVEQAIAAAADHARAANDALQTWVEQEVARHRGKRVPVAELLQLPDAVRVQVVRQICAHAGVDLDALHRRTLTTIDAALRRGGRARQWDLHPGRRLHLRNGLLWVERAGRQVRDDTA